MKGDIQIHIVETITQPVVSEHDGKRCEPNKGVTG